MGPAGGTFTGFAPRQERIDADYLRSLASLQKAAPSNPELIKAIGEEKQHLLSNQRRGTDVLNDAVLTSAIRGAEVILTGKGVIVSRNAFKPPVRITYLAKTDSTNIRLSYACDQIIFNWEVNPDELRIGGGPANGQHVKGAGRVPRDKFVTIVQEVTPKRMTISGDGTERASRSADFSKVNAPIKIFQGGSTVTVRSIQVEQMK